MARSTTRIALLTVALSTALCLCVVSPAGCGKKKGEVAAKPAREARSPGPREGLAQFSHQFATELTSFHEDVKRLLEDGRLGSMIQHDTYDAVVRLVRDRAERLHLDLVCVVNPEGKTWLRASNPIERGGTELYDTTGTCDEGLCVDLHALIRRALDQPASCQPSVEVLPPSLLSRELLFDFRVADLLGNGVPRTDLADRRLDRAARVPLLIPGSLASERRALMMLDVLPVTTQRGEQIGVLVAGWLMSRTSTLPESFRLSQRTDASIYLERTRVSTTVSLEDRAPVLGSRMSEDLWDRVCTMGTFAVGRVDLGYGDVNAAFDRITDGTGRYIGALMVEQPSLAPGTEIEFVRPAAKAEGAEGADGHGKAEEGGEGHGKAEEGGAAAEGHGKAEEAPEGHAKAEGAAEGHGKAEEGGGH